MRIHLTTLLLAFALPLCAQISEGGRPMSESLPLSTPTAHALPALNIDAARSEDAQHPEWQRFAAPVNTQVTLEQQGDWTDVPGGRLWRCALTIPNGQAMVLLFDQLRLPQGSRFFAHDPKGAHVWGAYTEKSNTKTGKFTLGPIPGREVVLELFEPDNVKGQTDLLLNRVDIVYDANLAGVLGFGDALPCHVNINCPEGANWQAEKRGIARILMVFSNGTGWCSGSLIANVRLTAEPYFLTAHHCQLIGNTPSFDQWRFDFEYEAAGCPNPGSEPQRRSVLGCERISFRAETDFMLLRIEPIPANYGVYFNGWTRSTTPPTTGTFIHHPLGDIKKISVENTFPNIHDQSINWGGIFGVSAPNTHWDLVPTIGTFQPGSSGSPLLGTNKRIYGQLHGGVLNSFDNCIVEHAYFGRFDLSWDQGGDQETQLKDWLDPDGTNRTALNGYEQPGALTYTISGRIETHGGKPMENVTLTLTGGTSETTTTDALGNYIFEDIPAGESYTITPSIQDNAVNGVTSFDIVLFSKHLLGQQDLDSPWKIIAGDANKSNSLTAFDMVDVQKVILGVNNQFSNNASWRFFPAFSSFSNPLQPFNNMPPEVISINNLQQDYTVADFIGVKIGDANANAKP